MTKRSRLLVLLASGFLVIVVLGNVLEKRGSGGFEHPSIGENGEIYATGDIDAVLAAVDRTGMDEMNKAIAAHDVIGMQQMIAAGKVLQVKKGTKALVIESGFAVTKVRITDGEYTNQAVWVPYEFVIKK